jgi:hypothetical protein
MNESAVLQSFQRAPAPTFYFAAAVPSRHCIISAVKAASLNQSNYEPPHFICRLTSIQIMRRTFRHRLLHMAEAGGFHNPTQQPVACFPDCVLYRLLVKMLLERSRKVDNKRVAPVFSIRYPLVVPLDTIQSKIIPGFIKTPQHEDMWGNVGIALPFLTLTLSGLNYCQRCEAHSNWK